MATDRGKGCLIAVAIVLALVAVGLALVGPTLARYGGRFAGSVSKMKRAETEMKEMARENPWREPANLTLGAEQLDRFLEVRARLQKLYAETGFDLRDLPRGGRKPDIGQVASIVEGMGSIVSSQTQVFLEVKLNPAEYRYVERIVYRRWRPALKRAGTYPMALAAAADEIDRAAEGERDAALARRLRAVAAELRERRPGAPEGFPEEIHALLLTHVAEIERYSLDELREMPLPEVH
jgi:hypothetical protein